MTKKLILTGTLAMTFIAVFAQDSTFSLKLSGYLDAYYRYNFDDAKDGSGSNSYTSFTKSQNSFTLGMASLKLDASALSGKLTAVADLGFGPRAEEFSYYDYASKSSLTYVKQLYATYAVSSKVKFTVGKFATHVGYELLDAPLNRNYSMSYMFTNGPFFHTGLKADITAGQMGFMLGVANFIDETTSSTTTKTLIGQISGATKNGLWKAYLNYAGYFGADEGKNPSSLKSFNQVDLVVTGTLSKKFNIGFNATMQNRGQVAGSSIEDGSWYGFASYLNFDPTAKVGLTLRSEYISDSKMIYFGSKSILANTLSLNYKLGPIVIVPEFRLETADSDIYSKGDGTIGGSSASALVAFIFKF